MFEMRLQTYWGDADAAGRVFFPNYFRFVECADKEALVEMFASEEAEDIGERMGAVEVDSAVSGGDEQIRS